ncbi:Hsp20/alpha crystallin family protein [Geotalea toluenoxydans]|uniref:Hsp20/alpha crystallin family protein n=1 Tax=Geotalea toluenoxydans TaxID=421624 RepID=UPI000A9B91E7|nr:Hsp20/alpha crystallin family protein [Geotalea toluenoxydans]
MTFAVKMVKSTKSTIVSMAFEKGQDKLLVLQSGTSGVVMAVIPRYPLEWLNFFRQQMDEIFSYLSTLEGKDGRECEFSPSVDVFETPDCYVVEFELPGFAGEDLSLTTCCNTMVLEGVKREDDGAVGASYICMERQFGHFCRTVEIPPAVDMDRAKANYEKGVLSVVFPKLQDKNTLIRDIRIEEIQHGK